MRDLQEESPGGWGRTVLHVLGYWGLPAEGLSIHNEKPGCSGSEQSQELPTPTGRAKLDLANVWASGSQNSQAQQRTPGVWALSQDSPATSTPAALPVGKLRGWARHKQRLWLRAPTFCTEIYSLWFSYFPGLHLCHSPPCIFHFLVTSRCPALVYVQLRLSAGGWEERQRAGKVTPHPLQ